MQNQIIQTLSSREVAGMVDKEHNMLLRDIRRYCRQLGQSNIAQSDFSQKIHTRIARIKQCHVIKLPRKAVNL